ncbi:hypothetical protein D3C76_1526710 [compost metagenome]
MAHGAGHIQSGNRTRCPLDQSNAAVVHLVQRVASASAPFLINKAQAAVNPVHHDSQNNNTQRHPDFSIEPVPEIDIDVKRGACRKLRMDRVHPRYNYRL